MIIRNEATTIKRILKNIVLGKAGEKKIRKKNVNPY
jgi:hypothetical protein